MPDIQTHYLQVLIYPPGSELTRLTRKLLFPQLRYHITLAEGLRDGMESAAAAAAAKRTRPKEEEEGDDKSGTFWRCWRSTGRGRKWRSEARRRRNPEWRKRRKRRRPDERGSHAMTFRPSFLTRRRRERPLSGSSRALGLESKGERGLRRRQRYKSPSFPPFGHHLWDALRPPAKGGGDAK